MQLLSMNMIVHVALGAIALLGGLAALASKKGSPTHVRSGTVFAFAMIPVVITTFVSMFHEFLPLAIVLAAAEIYLVPSALLSVNRRHRFFVAGNLIVMPVAALIFLFSAIQFVRINIVLEQFFVGPLVIAATFGWLLFDDITMLRTRHALTANHCIRRHLARMILAFTIAVMALVRIGTNFGVSLEMTVVLPLTIAFAAIAWVYRKYPVNAGVTSAAAG